MTKFATRNTFYHNQYNHVSIFTSYMEHKDIFSHSSSFHYIEIPQVIETLLLEDNDPLKMRVNNNATADITTQEFLSMSSYAVCLNPTE